jgi:hypothetical protein
MRTAETGNLAGVIGVFSVDFFENVRSCTNEELKETIFSLRHIFCGFADGL